MSEATSHLAQVLVNLERRVAKLKVRHQEALAADKGALASRIRNQITTIEITREGIREERTTILRHETEVEIAARDLEAYWNERTDDQ